MIPLLGIYPKETKTLIQKNLSTPMSVAELFTIVKIWKQPKCPSVDEWIKQLWVTYTRKYYLAIKKKLGCKKEESFTFCDSTDGPGKHYTE